MTLRLAAAEAPVPAAAWSRCRCSGYGHPTLVPGRGRADDVEELGSGLLAPVGAHVAWRKTEHRRYQSLQLFEDVLNRHTSL